MPSLKQWVWLCKLVSICLCMALTCPLKLQFGKNGLVWTSEKFIVPAAIVLILSGCVTVDSRDRQVWMTPSLRKNRLDAGAPILSVSAERILGLVPIYSSSSEYSGSRPLRHKPDYLLANGGNDDISMIIKMSKPSHLPPPGVLSETNAYISRMTDSLRGQIRRTWNNRMQRKIEFRLYITHKKYAVSRRIYRLLLGNKFYLEFYMSGKYGFNKELITSMLSHEAYHIMAGDLGIHKSYSGKNKNLTKMQKHILSETAAELFGPCVALRTTGVLHRDLYGPPDVRMLDHRRGTLSDAQMRLFLEPGNKTAGKESAYLVSEALFFTLWADIAGQDTEIKLGTHAADRLLGICDQHLADPQDLWPVLWKLAHDGAGAPEFPPGKLYVSPAENADGL